MHVGPFREYAHGAATIHCDALYELTSATPLLRKMLTHKGILAYVHTEGSSCVAWPAMCLTSHNRDAVGQAMCFQYFTCAVQNDAAVFRTQETLENGCKEIDECVASFEDVGIQDRSMVWNTDLVETLELENLLCNAAITMHSAEARKVGCTCSLACTFCTVLTSQSTRCKST